MGTPYQNDATAEPHYAWAKKLPEPYGEPVSEIHELSVLELAQSIRDGEVSPTEVAQHTAERAAEIGPQVGAFITLTPDLALEQAQQAEELLRTASRTDTDRKSTRLNSSHVA